MFRGGWGRRGACNSKYQRWDSGYGRHPRKEAMDIRIAKSPDPVPNTFVTHDRHQLLDTCKYECLLGLPRRGGRFNSSQMEHIFYVTPIDSPVSGLCEFNAKHACCT